MVPAQFRDGFATVSIVPPEFADSGFGAVPPPLRNRSSEAPNEVVFATNLVPLDQLSFVFVEERPLPIGLIVTINQSDPGAFVFPALDRHGPSHLDCVDGSVRRGERIEKRPEKLQP